MQVRVLIVDDSKATRRVLSAIVSSRWTVCGQAENGKSAVKMFRELRPDLVLLDLARPDIDGIEAGRQMHAIDPSVPLVLFTLLDHGDLKALLAMHASARSFRSRKGGSSWRVSSRSCLNLTPQAVKRSRKRTPGDQSPEPRGTDCWTGEVLYGQNSNCG